MKPIISKSQYLKGLQCPKNLWFYRHRKDLIPEIDAAQQAIFDTGNIVGEMAMQYFADDNAQEVTNEYWDIVGGIEATQKYIADGAPNIYEATAMHPNNGCYSRIDILHKADDGTWHLVEVKSSTRVKSIHFDDMAFQHYVFRSAGYNISKCFMLVIDNQYHKDGAIDPKKMFKLENISEKVFAKYDDVHTKANQMIAMLNAKDTEPEIAISDHCNKPYQCEFKHHCWQHIPDYSVYNIYRFNKVDDVIGKIHSYDIADIPTDLLPNNVKQIDVTAYQNNQPHVAPANIAEWLGTLSYPLYYLDYETIAPAIPVFDGTHPFQQIPFQFSLHIQQIQGGETHHIEFLHQEQSDPREAFAKALVKSCGDTGSVVVYNQGFEMARNRELAKQVPEYADALLGINARVIDLMVPFKKRWLYHPQQQSSCSIKTVLPIYTDFSYDELSIGNGGDAMGAYLDFIHGKSNDTETLFANLKQYCKLDTFAMVELMKKLLSS